MRAPRRASSCTCMKRFSKIVSVMWEMPLERVISAMNCAWRSVGKPGKGSVTTSTGLMRPPWRTTRMPLSTAVTSAPARRTASSAVVEQLHVGAGERHVTAGHGDGHGIGTGLDAVRQHAVGARRRAR